MRCVFVCVCCVHAQVYWAVYSEEGGGVGTTGETPTGTFTLRTDSGYAAGAVAYNNYSSSLDNHRLLMGYGFSLHPNPASSHTVRLRQDTAAKEDGTPLNGNVARRQLLSAAIAASSLHRCTVGTPLPPPLLAALAAAAADERQLDMIHGRLSASSASVVAEAFLKRKEGQEDGGCWQIAAKASLQAEVAATLQRMLARTLRRLKHGKNTQADSTQMEEAAAVQPPTLVSMARHAAAAYRLSVKEVVIGYVYRQETPINSFNPRVDSYNTVLIKLHPVVKERVHVSRTALGEFDASARNPTFPVPFGSFMGSQEGSVVDDECQIKPCSLTLPSNHRRSEPTSGRARTLRCSVA